MVQPNIYKSALLKGIPPGSEIHRKFKEGQDAYSRQNYIEAFEIWSKLVEEQKIAEAYYNLGIMYSLGQGTDRDYDQAKSHFRLAAQKGLVEAKYNYAILLEKIQVNYYTAFKWYRETAEAGLPEAQYKLGIIYRYGQGVKSDLEKAIEWLGKSAEQNYPQAQYELGIMYLDGIGCKEDKNKAKKYLLLAAESGNAAAQCSIGYMCIDKGSVKNTTIIKEWLEKSAKQGYLEAKIKLWEIYHGEDFAKLMELTHSMAEAGDDFVQYCLGNFYNHGGYKNGVKFIDKNEVVAAIWFYRAAQQGNCQGLYELGLIYEEGRATINKDLNKALKCYKKIKKGKEKRREEYIDSDINIKSLREEGYIDGSINIKTLREKVANIEKELAETENYNIKGEDDGKQ